MNLPEKYGGYSSTLMQGPSIELDLRGLKCPMPVLRTRKALRRLAVGDQLLVLCSDPLALIDIPNLVREEGHQLLRQSSGDDGESVYVIVKTGGES